jgi:hypothetical protein
LNLARKPAVGGLVAAAAGIVVQIVGGADYPTIPPGVPVLLAAAVLFAVRTRWAPPAGLLVTLFICIGAVTTPNVRDHLADPSAMVTFVGTVIEIVGLAVGLIFGIAVVGRSIRKEQPREPHRGTGDRGQRADQKLRHPSLATSVMGLDRARVDKMLDLVGLTSAEARRRVGTYSLGMRQRLGVGQIRTAAPAALGSTAQAWNSGAAPCRSRARKMGSGT